MFETYELMYLKGIRESSGFAPAKLKSELISLMKRAKDKSPDRAERQIATLFTLFEMFVRFRDEFKIQLETKCNEFLCSFHDFIVIMKRYKDIFLPFHKSVFADNYEFIRNNKKFNFWMNTGNIKISSIHSFKGWESDTVFLILQKRKEGDPSFDELLYTGITRTISNLVVINLGNKEYHLNMKRLIEACK